MINVVKINKQHTLSRFQKHMPKIICAPLSFAEPKKAVGKRKFFKRALYRKPHKKHETVLFLGFY